ncbi:PIN domain-containing protein [Thermococcus sp. 21S7]|uniref:PIN domain-containing protein n=1 Tax=Thermococcus sp. 21S7 TaxID=1638221 RepID=UPI0014396FD0
MITRKAKISHEDFEFLISTLREHVMFVGEEFYAEFIPVALEITPDKDDADFIALSLKVNAPL